MRVHPEVARLRGHLPAQPRTDAALAQWHARGEVAAVLAALAGFEAGAPVADLPALAELFGEAEAGLALAEGLVDGLTEALAAEPLAQLPLGHSTAPGAARLNLARRGSAGLSLLALAPRAMAMPVSALFEDAASYEIILAGEGRALLHALEAGRLTSREIALAPGTRLVREGGDRARQIVAVTRPLLVLQLTREPARPQPSREIALADGSLVRTISGCKATSQQMMALAVLGALGHAAAVPSLERLARDPAAERDLRWEALRQCLALDARAGLAVLGALVGERGDMLAAPAAALHRQLRAQRPDLAPFMAEPA